MRDAHPNSIYPKDWSSDTTEDRAGYISLEKSPVYAATARTAIEIAGLKDVVKVSRRGFHRRETQHVRIDGAKC
jgi:hypothetical protein